MNKRIRKKKDKQMMVWAVTELAASYRRQVDEREKRCKELSAQYGICVELDEDDPLGSPPLIAYTPEIMQEQKHRRRELRAFVRRCEMLYEQQQRAQRG
ncbi:hypothetical protein LV595_18740 [Clostridioides difficile]|nr:hypothetical protein [Clostridioides difficile]